MRDVSKQFDDVGHQSELFDALLYKMLKDPEKYRIVVTPNEYGDFLSDMACGMVGSIGLGASANYSFDDSGQGICTPSAALLAFSMLLTHAGCRGLGTMIDEAVRGCIANGESTGDLGGKLNTAAFTAAVIKHMGAK